MRAFLSAFIALLLLSLSMPLLAASGPPMAFVAEYDVLRNGEKLGKATMRFVAAPRGLYELRTSTVGSEGLAAIAGAAIEERSLLSWNDGPETVSYEYKQKIAWKTRQRGLRVDAEAGHVVSTDKNGERVLPYRPGILDRHALTVALMQDLASGKKGDLLYTVPDGDALGIQRYRQAPPETIQTAQGGQRAIRVERVRDSGGGRTTTLWLARDRGFVPLRLVQKEPDGETIEMRILTLR